jgi:hypothetical protein
MDIMLRTIKALLRCSWVVVRPFTVDGHALINMVYRDWIDQLQPILSLQFPIEAFQGREPKRLGPSPVSPPCFCPPGRGMEIGLPFSHAGRQGVGMRGC